MSTPDGSSIPSVGNSSLSGGSQTSSSGGATPSGGNTGDILQASTTVTSLAVVFLALFPVYPSLAKVELFKIGHIPVPCGMVLLFCGISALISSVWSIDHLRREANIKLKSSPLGLLLVALLLFAIMYIGIAASYPLF